jgi:hypothetical protein
LLTNSTERTEAQQVAFVEAAQAQRVGHVVYLSQLAADQQSPVRFLRPSVSWTPATSPRRSRRADRRRARRHAPGRRRRERQPDPQRTVLRPTLPSRTTRRLERQTTTPPTQPRR